MEDIRNYRTDDDRRNDNDNPVEWELATSDEDVPFHIPRD